MLAYIVLPKYNFKLTVVRLRSHAAAEKKHNFREDTPTPRWSLTRHEAVITLDAYVTPL